MVKDKKIVITGEYLGVIEEYLPNKNSTFVQNGKIYATKSGMVEIDQSKKEIEIKTHQEEDRKVVRIGDIVIGTILHLRKFSVGLNFYTINKKIHFNSCYFGNIHVSQISHKYIDQIKEAFQPTDIVRAKVIEQSFNEYNLSTVGKNLGVIHADCVICGTPLDKVGFNKLKCSMCENIETRKLASDYRQIENNLRF